MKKILFTLLTAILLGSCSESASLVITVTNPLAINRSTEMVELSMEEITQKLELSETEQLLLLDIQGIETPYQITHDGKLIFPVAMEASESTIFTLVRGVPHPVEVIACGRQYPERLDDLAWENDRVAFRAYGPALQMRGDRLFGYDVWTKSVSDPVVEERYDNELNNGLSYHIDHGNGMDCYAVGPTLGGGATALFPDSNLIYPYAYASCEVLDNGPLRFTASLVYNPTIIGTDSVVTENRLISLDKGSQLNKTTISYQHLTKSCPIATGIVLHKENPKGYAFDTEKGYISYADLTENPYNDNGTIYIGALFSQAIQYAAPYLFTEEERPQRGDALGHILAISEYKPNTEYLYYWGSGWSKYGFAEEKQWIDYLEQFGQQVRTPLLVELNSTN